ncbi:MAG: hypothetical protein AVDCRST_MAG88-2028, partial [uncultured Thermomicrobiales bacterium]
VHHPPLHARRCRGAARPARRHPLRGDRRRVVRDYATALGASVDRRSAERRLAGMEPPDRARHAEHCAGAHFLAGRGRGAGCSLDQLCPAGAVARRRRQAPPGPRTRGRNPVARLDERTSRPRGEAQALRARGCRGVLDSGLAHPDGRRLPSRRRQPRADRYPHGGRYSDLAAPPRLHSPGRAPLAAGARV